MIIVIVLLDFVLVFLSMFMFNVQCSWFRRLSSCSMFNVRGSGGSVHVQFYHYPCKSGGSTWFWQFRTKIVLWGTMFLGLNTVNIIQGYTQRMKLQRRLETFKISLHLQGIVNLRKFRTIVSEFSSFVGNPLSVYTFISAVIKAIFPFSNFT